MNHKLRSLTLLICLALFCGWAVAQSDEDSHNQKNASVGKIQIDETLLPMVAGSSKLLGGNPLDQVEIDDQNVWRCGHCFINTPLPEGYPNPTAPGAIALKSYPVVRRAKVEGRIAPDLASNFGFWKLFSHIKSREIAMTSPVEMEYTIDIEAANPKVRGWAMSFLYRSVDLGPTGVAGAVMVEDEQPLTVLSIGIQGGYGVRHVLENIDKLTRLAEQLEGWEIVGNPRALFYNGPEIRSAHRWGEVQIAIQKKASAQAE